MIREPYNARDFLESVHNAKIEIRRCEWRLRGLRDQAESITAKATDNPGGGSSHGNSPQKDSILVTLADQSAKLDRLKEEAEERVIAVEGFIDELDDPTHKIILALRYCDCMNWDDILKELPRFGVYMVERTMYTHHGDALREAQRVWEEKGL